VSTDLSVSDQIAEYTGQINANRMNATAFHKRAQLYLFDRNLGSAMDDIAEALEQGHLLCIFPEGRLTQDGEINEFKVGIEHILERTPVPVVPMALQGLWGSFFSHSHGGVFKKPFRPQWRHIKVLADTSILSEQVTAEALQEMVIGLRGSYR